MFDHYRKDARLPEQLQRAMAAEAEASREARAKVIAADGEKRASKALREASNVIEQSPSALQLRYLQVCMFILSPAGPPLLMTKYQVHCSEGCGLASKHSLGVSFEQNNESFLHRKRMSPRNSYSK